MRLGGGLNMGRRLIWYGWRNGGDKGKVSSGAEVSELWFFGDLWAIMGCDGTSFGHKSA